MGIDSQLAFSEHWYQVTILIFGTTKYNELKISAKYFGKRQ
jgi:hypothetical protein